MKKFLVCIFIFLKSVSISYAETESSPLYEDPVQVLAEKYMWPDDYHYTLIDSHTMTVQQLKNIFQKRIQKLNAEMEKAKKQKRNAHPTTNVYKILNFKQEQQVNDFVTATQKYINFISRQYQSIFNNVSDQDTVYIITSNNPYMYKSMYPAVKNPRFGIRYTSIFGADFQHLLTYPQNHQQTLSDLITRKTKNLYNICTETEEDTFCDYANDLIKIRNNEKIENPELLQMLERML